MCAVRNAVGLVLLALITAGAQQISYFNQGLLRQSSRDLDLLYLSMPTNFSVFATTNFSFSLVSSTNGYWIPTNAISAWPTQALSPGFAWLGNSNGVVYLLTSDPSSTAWTKTNLIATP